MTKPTFLAETRWNNCTSRWGVVCTYIFIVFGLFSLFLLEMFIIWEYYWNFAACILLNRKWRRRMMLYWFARKIIKYTGIISSYIGDENTACKEIIYQNKLRIDLFATKINQETNKWLNWFSTVYIQTLCNVCIIFDLFFEKKAQKI